MKSATLLAAVAIVIAGCSQGESMAEDTTTPTPKKPNMTAAEYAKAVQGANMPDAAKKVLAGSANQNSATK